MSHIKIVTAFGALFLLPLVWSCSPQTSNPTLDTTVELSYEEPDLTQDLTLSQEIRDDLSQVEKPQEELEPPEPEQTLAQEVQDLEKLGSWEEGQTQQSFAEEIKYDFPITINKQVEYYLDFFQNKQRKSFSLWLARSGRYVPMITQQLEEAGLPKDLAYLPMIESGYSLTAYSRAKAVGPWQFMRATAIHYGLNVNSYVDERRDPVLSTQAAIRYLAELYEMFESWPLAVAGYNAGEGKIQRGIKRYNTANFWELAQQRYLNLETKRYVPKLIAAIMIAKSPEKYGFSDIQYLEPITYDTVQVPRWTNLEAIAIAAGCDLADIKNLNRQLRKMITPPEFDFYDIKVPQGKGDLLAQNLPRIHVSVSTQFKNHTILAHDTLDTICKKYNLNKTTLLKANNLRKAKLTAGNHLRIPYQTTRYKLLTEKEMANKNKYATSRDQFILHTVKPGESVSKIATLYGVDSQMVAAWNGLASIHKIKAGQQLALYVNPISANNDSGISLSTNSIKNSQEPAAGAKPQSTYYKVQGGDSLWAIARKFNLRSEDIKRWNNLTGNLIHPGLTLLLQKNI